MTQAIGRIVVGIVILVAVASLVQIIGVKYAENKKTEETKNKVVDIDKDVRKETTTTTTTTPDGTKTQVTTTVEDTKTVKRVDKKTDTVTQETKTPVYQDKVNISLLAGVARGSTLNPLIFGASVTKPILGPITVGIWGFTDLSCGVSIGVQF